MEQAPSAPTYAAVEALRLALSDDGQREALLSQTDALKALVEHTVDELRTAGLPPEKVIVAVKAILASAGLDDGARHVKDRIVDWTIQRYYPTG
jgi:hypothetical protein